MEKEVVDAALILVKKHSKVKAIVLECTNMPPFTHAVEQATGLRVWDVLTLGKWLYAGHYPRIIGFKLLYPYVFVIFRLLLSALEFLNAWLCVYR